MEPPKLKSDVTDDSIKDSAVENDDREPTKEELLEDLRIGLRQAIAGEGMPARESIEALRQRIYRDADRQLAFNRSGGYGSSNQ